MRIVGRKSEKQNVDVSKSTQGERTMSYEDVPCIRTYAEAKRYFEATKPYSKGRHKGKTPVGKRSRSNWIYINMHEGKDYYRVTWHFDGEDNNVTYYKDTPMQAHLTIHGWDVSATALLSRLLGAVVLQHQFDLWWLRYGSPGKQIYLGTGTHIFENGTPQIKHNTITKTYLKRRKWNDIYKKCKPFVDYLTITNKIRDDGFSREEVEDVNRWNSASNYMRADFMKLAESTNMNDHYTLAKVLATRTDGAINNIWRTDTLKNDALTKPMLKTLKHHLKIQFAKDLFEQREVTVSGWTRDSNAKYAQYINK